MPAVLPVKGSFCVYIIDAWANHIHVVIGIATTDPSACQHEALSAGIWHQSTHYKTQISDSGLTKRQQNQQAANTTNQSDWPECKAARLRKCDSSRKQHQAPAAHLTPGRATAGGSRDCTCTAGAQRYANVRRKEIRAPNHCKHQPLHQHSVAQ